MKDRKYNGQEKKDKQRSMEHTNKTEYRVTRTPIKTECEPKCYGRLTFPDPLVAPVGLI